MYSYVLVFNAWNANQRKLPNVKLPKTLPSNDIDRRFLDALEDRFHSQQVLFRQIETKLGGLIN